MSKPIRRSKRLTAQTLTSFLGLLTLAQQLTPLDRSESPPSSRQAQEEPQAEKTNATSSNAPPGKKPRLTKGITKGKNAPKARRGGGGGARRNTGKLAHIMTMPIDVFAEVLHGFSSTKRHGLIDFSCV